MLRGGRLSIGGARAWAVAAIIHRRCGASLPLPDRGGNPPVRGLPAVLRIAPLRTAAGPGAPNTVLLPVDAARLPRMERVSAVVAPRPPRGSPAAHSAGRPGRR